SGVMESLACCNEMKAGNAQRNNQLNKYNKTSCYRYSEDRDKFPNNTSFNNPLHPCGLHS
ncbi:MAG: hypothetical protein JXR70_07240, partial [Spirochaetales bacterium]|nr:hypothetical protein [Spirochaetales bacterium]